MVELFISIILGILQGFAEFLPISSSGHLVVGRNLFGLSEAGLLFDTMLHFGTFISVVIVFWEDIIQLIKRPFSKLTLLLIVGTIPAVIAALLFEDFFEEIFQTGVTVGWAFLITGLILWFADTKKEYGKKRIPQIKYSDALIIGVLQSIAIIPGISRAGSTIAGSLFRGVHREEAARFSFLLSLPAIFGAVLLQSYKLFSGEQISSIETIGIIPLIVGTLVSAVIGYIAIKWMLKILKKGSLKVFSFYVWTLGILVLIFQFTGKW